MPEKIVTNSWVHYAERHMDQSLDPTATEQCRLAFFNGAWALLSFVCSELNEGGNCDVNSLFAEMNSVLATQHTIVRVRRSVVPIGKMQIVGIGGLFPVEMPSNDFLRRKLGKDTVAYFKGRWTGTEWEIGERVDDQSW